MRHSWVHCSLTFSLVISLAFPKSRIKLGKQGYLIFWKSQGLLLSLQALSRGNTLFVKTWLYIANGYHDVSQWAYPTEKCFSRLVAFPALWSQFLSSWITTAVSSKYWYKSSLLLINSWLRKLKPVNILFSRSTAVCCSTKTGSKGWSETTLHIKKGAFGGF